MEHSQSKSQIPEWLESFKLMVGDQNENYIFDSDIDDISNFQFNHVLGGKIGTELTVFDKIYIIKSIEIYTRDSNKPGLILNIIIEND